MTAAFAQPPSPPSPRTAAPPSRPARPASLGSSIEEDDLYVSPKASPPVDAPSQQAFQTPPSQPPSQPASTSNHATHTHTTYTTHTSNTLSGDFSELSDYNTWSAAMNSASADPGATAARKASDTSNGSAGSKRGLPQPPRTNSNETTTSTASATRQGSLQPTLSQRYQQLKERSAARRASQSSDGHTFTTSWERRGSERSDDFHSSAAGFGRLPALEDVQAQQRRMVASPEPAHPPSSHERQNSHPPLSGFPDQQNSHPPLLSHSIHDQAPPSSFPGLDRQGSLPPIPLSRGTSEVSPQHSPTRRDSLPPIPAESPQSPQRRASNALPPIPSGTAPTSPVSPNQRRPGVPQANGENGNGGNGMRDFMPYASVYGGVDGEDDPATSASRRNTLPPLPSPPKEQPQPHPQPQEPKSQAQLYAQQQMAQQRQQAEERRKQEEARQHQVQHQPQQHHPQQPLQQQQARQPLQQQQAQPPQQRAMQPPQPIRSPVYDSDKDQPPLPSPRHAPPSGPPTPGPPSAFQQPQPPLQPGQSHSLPTRRTTLGHGNESYAAQQQPALAHAQTVRAPRNYAANLERPPPTPQPAGTPQQRIRPLHPEFTHGDLTIQVSSPGPTDFLVSYTVMTTASGLIASTLAQFPAGKAPRVAISESVPEAKLLLSALNYGNISHSSFAVAERDPLGVAEYLTLLRLYRKYQVSAFFTDLLQYQINQRAVELSQSLTRRDRLLTLDIVRLAVEAKSTRLWEMLNKYSGYWFEALSPGRLSAEEKDRLGKTGLEVLVAWNALRLGCGDRPEGVKVGYEGGRVAIWRVRDDKKKFYPCPA